MHPQTALPSLFQSLVEAREGRKAELADAAKATARSEASHIEEVSQKSDDQIGVPPADVSGAREVIDYDRVRASKAQEARRAALAISLVATLVAGGVLAVQRIPHVMNPNIHQQTTTVPVPGPEGTTSGVASLVTQQPNYGP